MSHRSTGERARVYRVARRLVWIGCGVGVAALMGACFEDGFGDGSGGGSNVGSRSESGSGVFHYVCTGWGDPACSGYDSGREGSAGTTTGISVPQRVALNSRFDVRHALGGRVTGVHSASRTILDRDDVGFVAVSPGVVGLEAYRQDTTVAAYMHIRVVESAAIQLSGYAGETLNVGTSMSLGAQLVDSQGRGLGGGVDYEWFSSDPMVVDVEVGVPFNPGSEHDDAARIVARGAGTATITIQANGHTLEFDITTVVNESEALPSGCEIVNGFLVCDDDDDAPAEDDEEAEGSDDGEGDEEEGA